MRRFIHLRVLSLNDPWLVFNDSELEKFKRTHALILANPRYPPS